MLTAARRTSPSSTSGRIDCIVRRTDTNGFGQWAYSRSIAPTPSRRALPSTWRRTIPSVGASGVNFVAIVRLARASAPSVSTASPTMCSEVRGP